MDITLALGGGGVRGVAHIGVLRALEKHGFNIKAIAGTSAGWLAGAVYAAGYSTATVKLDFQRFASVRPEFPGEAIRYGLTIPSNARHPEAGRRLVEYLLGPEGQAVMAQNHQPMITPALADNYEAVPEAIRALCDPGD